MVDREAFRDPWRVRCPQGHASVRALDESKMGYCEKCNRSYGFGELVDAKEDRRVGV